jgi:hypothetical protein
LTGFRHLAKSGFAVYLCVLFLNLMLHTANLIMVFLQDFISLYKLGNLPCKFIFYIISNCLYTDLIVPAMINMVIKGSFVVKLRFK